MRTGESFRFSTNREFLSYVLGKDVPAQFKSTYDLNGNTFIWMVYFEGNSYSAIFKDNGKEDWINIYSENRIEENYVGNKFNFNMVGYTKEYRVVFEKIGTKESQRYIFRGVYKLSAKESTKKRRVLIKIADEINLEDYV